MYRLAELQKITQMSDMPDTDPEISYGSCVTGRLSSIHIERGILTKTSYLRALMVVAAAALALCLLAGMPAEAAFPGTNGKIAFERGLRIWVKNPSLSSPETELRDEGVADRQAAFSPDGSRVAFMRSNEIYVTNADGSGTARRLTNDLLLDSNPTWSHDGTRIAFQRRGSDNQYNIWTMNADGTDQTQRTSETGGTLCPPGRYRCPTLPTARSSTNTGAQNCGP